ncbi:MAG: glycosyltransferase family 61 protein [Bacilli bacterium]|nr:glycosyltransferase family 61 protein [Bacilli bacterium]
MNATKLYIDKPMINQYKKYISKDYLNNKKLSTIEIKNGFILPAKKRFMQREPLCGNGGVLDCDLNYVEQSAQLGYNMSDRLNGKYNFNKDTVKYIDETVVYLNHYINHWGHFLIDVIGRLWYRKDNTKYVLTTDLNSEMELKGSFLDFIELSGLKKEDIIIINQPTKFKKIIIPENSIYPGKYYTKEYINTFKTVIKNCKIKKTNEPKIYLSRQLLNANKETGEKRIEDFFINNGFKPIHMEKLSLQEQISYIYNAKEIACMSGTLPHNILFSKENTKIIILNKTYALNMHQFLINQASKCNCIFIDTHKSILPVLYGLGPFIIKETDQLKKYSEDNNYKYSFNLINKKWRIENIKYILKYLKINRLRIAKDKFVNKKELYNYYKKK